jgi:hypothetical protein
MKINHMSESVKQFFQDTADQTAKATKFVRFTSMNAHDAHAIAHMTHSLLA